jgi:peptidoglycan/LPS O-acetylase OafA/YrhL
MPQLDGLRAIAASLVIVEHFSPASQYVRFSLGVTGVWLFYVLSGYLITGILLNAREAGESAGGSLRPTWISFYMRRVRRAEPLPCAAAVPNV